MKTITKIILLLSLFIILCTIILAINFNIGKKNEPITFQANNIYPQTLIVVADVGFDPYSFLDENGKPNGYDVELIYMLGDALSMNVEVRLMEWHKAIEAMKNKKADIILGLAYPSTISHDFQTSIPTSSNSFFVFGKKDYGSLENLYEKKIAVLKASEAYTSIIKPFGLKKNTTSYNTYKEAFESVENGDNEYIIITYSVGRRLSIQYKDIKPFGSALISKSFSIAVASKEVDLIEKLNKAILEKKEDGTIAHLSEKWLKQYIELISVSDFITQYWKFLLAISSLVLLTPLLFSLYIYRKRSVILKYNESILMKHASEDFLTKIFNRSAAEKMIKQIILTPQIESKHALFMIDIDNFKIINDSYGHEFGDQVLLRIANELKKVFRDYDIVARMGGDEFLVFMKDYKNLAIVKDKANKLCTTLNEYKIIQNISIQTPVSIGIVLCLNDTKDFLTLYKNADTALYNAKRKGRNQFIIYNSNSD